MNKTYHFYIPYKYGEFQSNEYKSIEECVEKCKKYCKDFGVNYDDREVKLFFTEDFGETYEECTEEGELAS